MSTTGISSSTSHQSIGAISRNNLSYHNFSEMRYFKMTDSKLNIGIIIPSNNQAGAQKLAAIAATDLVRHGHQVHLYIPRLPYYYYFVTLRRNPITWLKVVRHYLTAYFRSRRFIFDDLLNSSADSNRAAVHNILRRPSRRQLSGLDRVLVMTIAQVAELDKIYPQERIIYQIHHPEESAYEFPDLFRAIRSRFKGKIVAISHSTAIAVSDHIAVPPVVPDAVSEVFWQHRFVSHAQKRIGDILFHFSLETHKGSEIGKILLETIRRVRPHTAVTVWTRDGDPRLTDVTVLRQISEKKLAEVLLSHKLLLFPSTFEGFGMPPIEAMACGCIPIQYPGIGASDLYSRDGITSVFIHDNIKKTAKRIAALLDDNHLLGKMRIAARDAVEPFAPEGYGIRLLLAAGVDVEFTTKTSVQL